MWESLTTITGKIIPSTNSPIQLMQPTIRKADGLYDWLKISTITDMVAPAGKTSTQQVYFFPCFCWSSCQRQWQRWQTGRMGDLWMGGSCCEGERPRFQKWNPAVNLGSSCMYWNPFSGISGSVQFHIVTGAVVYKTSLPFGSLWPLPPGACW